MVDVKVVGALYQRGHWVPPGTVIAVLPEQAEALIAQGVVEAALPAPVPRVPDPEPAPVPPIPTLDDEQE